MKENLKLKTKSIKAKILIIPLMITFIVIVLISAAFITEIKVKLMSQMKDYGANLASEITSEISNNNTSMDALNESIEERIRTLGTFIVRNVDKVNNDNLVQLAKQFNVDEINITDPTGKVIYSNLQSSLGSVFDSKHISYSVLKGDKSELMEDIRKSRENDNYYKYGYVRKDDGGIVQIGILANKVKKLSGSLEIQTLIDHLAKNKNIVYAGFVDKNNKIIAHSEKNKIGQVLDNEEIKAALAGKTYSGTNSYNGKTKMYNIIVPIIKDNVRIGAVDIGFSTENLNKSIYNMVVLTLIIAILSFALISFVMIKIANRITKPLNELVLVSQKIAKGEFDNEIIVKSNDEIGILALSFKNMSKSLKETIGTIKNEAAKIGDMASNLSANSEQMTAATNEVANAIQDVTHGSAAQSNDLVEVVDNMTDLADELQNIHDKLEHVKGSSDVTEDKAKIGKEQINILLKSIEDVKKSFETVVVKVNSLSSSVSQVGNITDVINGISEQTNLLALNAAIEAARAGEAGKGFAVVADEVRKLAEQSRESTEQIQKLIQSISNETADVIGTSGEVENYVEKQVVVVEDTIKSFNEMLQALSNISPLVNDTYTSLKNTIKSKDTVLNKIEGVTAVSQETSSSAEEISASSEQMLASTEEVSKFAAELNGVVQQLNEETNKFKI